jgi:hypothetical protein
MTTHADHYGRYYARHSGPYRSRGFQFTLSGSIMILLSPPVNAETVRQTRRQNVLQGPSELFAVVHNHTIYPKNGVFWDVTPCGSC